MCSAAKLTSLFCRLSGQPSSQHVVSVIVLIGHEQHATAADCWWRCILQAVALEYEVDIVCKLDALPTGHGQQPAFTTGSIM